MVSFAFSASKYVCRSRQTIALKVILLLFLTISVINTVFLETDQQIFSNEIYQFSIGLIISGVSQGSILGSMLFRVPCEVAQTILSIYGVDAYSESIHIINIFNEVCLNECLALTFRVGSTGGIYTFNIGVKRFIKL